MPSTARDETVTPANGGVPRDALTFERKNARRGELVRRKYLGGGLSPAEDSELSALQSEIDKAVDLTTQLPAPDPADVEYARSRLGLPPVTPAG